MSLRARTLRLTNEAHFCAADADLLDFFSCLDLLNEKFWDFALSSSFAGLRQNLILIKFCRCRNGLTLKFLYKDTLL